MDARAWPARFACTAVDASDGAFVRWDEHSGVPLDRAVASSCAVPGVYPPVTIRGRRYIDGGVRSATNADLARGYDAVLIVAVTMPGMDAMPAIAEAMRRQLDGEITVLRESGSRVEIIEPDAGSAASFGMNLMDFSRRAAVAAEGMRQGAVAGERLRAFWAGTPAASA
jgi:NTE family protein